MLLFCFLIYLMQVWEMNFQYDYLVALFHLVEENSNFLMYVSVFQFALLSFFVDQLFFLMETFKFFFTD